MKTFATLAGAIALSAGAAHAGLVDPALDLVLRESAPDDTVSALVFLVDQLDAAAMTDRLDAVDASFALRHETVVRALRDMAAGTQGELLADLAARRGAGDVASFKAYWVTNAVRVDATPAAIRAIAARPDVAQVYFNHHTELVDPVATAPDDGGPLAGGPEPGVQAVRAPEVWQLGITGSGVLTSTLDTGVDGNHEALASRWRGLDARYDGHGEWAFFDPVNGQTFPYADGSHGTHTMGSVCGGAPGDEVGVAPGAQWIHASTIDRISIARTVADSLDAFEWLIDPDGNPATAWDVPRACSNSWGLLTAHGYPNCDETFWNHLDNCEAAGIVILFSAGNEGGSGLRRPADRATDEYRTCAVAAVDGNNPPDYPVASFSSRGPTNCTPGGESAIKPDIAAPGVNVRSSVPGNGYSFSSGTSMASPHVNGVVCLMFEANPDLTVEQVKQIIYDTALDLGSPGEDNSYGYGLIDALAAVQEALATATLTFQFPGGLPGVFDPTGGTTIRVLVEGRSEEPRDGTGLVYYRTDDGDFTVESMDQVGDNEYEAVFPAFDCLSEVDYYFSVETLSGETVTSPFNAPDATYHADVYTGVNVSFADDFEEDLGWTVENSEDLTAGQWERGVPQGGGDRGDPANDADGSGQCYVTGLADGDNDIDGGTTILTSPTMDATDPDSVLHYSRWYSNTFGADPMNDIFVVDISDDGGATWHELETVGPAGAEVSGGWIAKAWLVRDIPNISNTDEIRVRFNASDLNDGSVVEAAVDGIEISALFCDGGLVGDIDGDGDVDFQDLLQLLSAWGPVADCPPTVPEDLNEDCSVDFDDILLLLSNWTG